MRLNVLRKIILKNPIKFRVHCPKKIFCSQSNDFHPVFFSRSWPRTQFLSDDSFLLETLVPILDWASKNLVGATCGCGSMGVYGRVCDWVCVRVSARVWMSVCVGSNYCTHIHTHAHSISCTHTHTHSLTHTRPCLCCVCVGRSMLCVVECVRVCVCEWVWVRQRLCVCECE